MRRIVGSSRHQKPPRIVEDSEGILGSDLAGAKMQNCNSFHLVVFAAR